MKKMLFGFTLSMAMSAVCYSATIHVPADQPTIQAGILVAAPGDTVLVAPGYYFENIKFAGKAIIVRSSDGPEVTTIDGSMPEQPHIASVVMFRNSEGPDSILDGFTIRGGRGIELYPKSKFTYGGGIFCEQTSPTIQNNIIKYNMAVYGGGIACKNKACPLITNNLITRNSTHHNIPGIIRSAGGGVYCYDKSAPTITHNVITLNTTDPYHPLSEGGGIYCSITSSASAQPTISHNTISYNKTGGQGCGIFCHFSGPVISNNIIVGNNSGDFGGGIWCAPMSSAPKANIVGNFISGNSARFEGGGICCGSDNAPKITNNMVCGNTTEGDGGGIHCSSRETTDLTNNTIVGNSAARGGGIYGGNSGSLFLSNMILWANHASMGPEVYMELGGWWPATCWIDYSDVKGGIASIYIEPGNAFNWGINMIVDDPLFVDVSNHDYHLLANSPCVNAGDGAAALDVCDFEGDPRISGQVVDMGADERYFHLYCTGDFNPGGTIQGKIIGPTSIPWPAALILGAGVLDPPLPHKWGDLFLASPLVLVPVGFIPASGVLIIEETVPVIPVAPYDIPMQALIQNKLSNLFVLEVR